MEVGNSPAATFTGILDIFKIGLAPYPVEKKCFAPFTVDD
jgi:hypothetical protein